MSSSARIFSSNSPESARFAAATDKLRLDGCAQPIAFSRETPSHDLTDESLELFFPERQKPARLSAQSLAISTTLVGLCGSFAPPFAP